MTETMTFGTLRIAYDDRVLRPREWTAEQSRWASDLMRDAPAGPVLELCSGAGQIGLLAVHGSGRALVCVDAEPVACAYAVDNAEHAGLQDRVDVRLGRLDEAVRHEERFPIILADPPWVPRDATERFPEDPILAIDGGDDGLDVARVCLRVIAAHLAPGGSALLQIGTAAQAETVRTELPAYADDLAVTEVRELERGVLVRLDRLTRPRP
jgi:release factor glutamine methyltransferase